MNRFHCWPFLAVLVIAASCASANVHVFGTVDPNDRTVTVPPGVDGITGDIKQALIGDGWRMVVDRGPTMTEGSVGEKTALQQFDTFLTRYRLLISSEQTDVCISATRFVVYSISLIDNKTGTEVLAMTGHGCDYQVIKEFRAALARAR